jgi:hypothetical protein
MNVHFNEYPVMFCGSRIEFKLMVRYSLPTPPRDSLEVDSIHVCMDLDWIELHDWDDLPMDDIRNNILKERKADREEFEHEEDAA